jgi:hypothetical protein
MVGMGDAGDDVGDCKERGYEVGVGVVLLIAL